MDLVDAATARPHKQRLVLLTLIGGIGAEGLYLQLYLKGLLEFCLNFALRRAVEVDSIERAQLVLLDFEENHQPILPSRDEQLVARVHFEAPHCRPVRVLQDVDQLELVPEVEMALFAASHQVAVELPDADVPSA